MRRVHASIKVGRWGKKEIKKQKASKGKGPAKSWPKARGSAPRTGEPHPGEAGVSPIFLDRKALSGS